jgi:4-amino-4-deoxy-L-arabinose transferase-like glycosyltransferase
MYRSGAPPKGANTMQPDSCPSHRPLMGLLALTLVVRLAALVLGADGLSRDPDNYRGLAENLLDRGVLGQGATPSAYRPPLYPLLLVPCVALREWSPAAIGVLHLALGMATVWGVHWLGRQWRLGRGAWCAAALVACDPILVHQTAQVMTETTAAFLATAALMALTVASERPTACAVAASGASIAFAALCRPTFLVLLACAAPLAIRHAPKRFSRALLASAYFSAAAAALAPWALRNEMQLGQPIVSTTHGGYTLWLGNNSSYYAFLRQRHACDVWRAADFDAVVLKARLADSGPSEIENDRREYSQAWDEIRRQPRMFLYASLVRLGRFWGLVPRRIADDEGRWRRGGRYATGAWYALEFVLAILGVWSLARQGNDAWPSPSVAAPPRPPVLASFLPGLLLAASFTVVHAVFWTDLRMRAPVAPVVALVAAVGTSRFVAAIMRRKAFADK